MDLRELYRDVILDHNRNPRNFGRLDPCDAAADGHNPLCGDRLHLTLRRSADRLTELRFDGHGCAISVASASLMGEAVTGHTIAEIDALYHDVHRMLTEHDHSPDHDLGKLAALSGVREFPARVKCASLCWHTLHAALHDSASTVSTE
jgi:nitrogen fixation protein NifU and related proteins